MGFAAVAGRLPISPWSPRAGAVGRGESRWGRWEREKLRERGNIFFLRKREGKYAIAAAFF
jgi:hypothetical protein